MFANEIKFWSDVLVATYPGWAINVAHNWGGSSAPGSNLGINIYAFDTSTAWSAACVVAQKELQEAQNALADSETKRQAVQAGAQIALLRASETRATTQEEITRRAMVLAMYYMAQTRTLKTIKTSMGHVDGHWMALIYRFVSGKSVLRPVYRSPAIGQGLLSPAKLAQWASEAMQQDAGTKNSGLEQLLRSEEMLVLPPSSGAIV